MRKWKFINGKMVELTQEQIRESEPHLWEEFKDLPEMPEGYYIGMTPNEEKMLGIRPRNK